MLVHETFVAIRMAVRFARRIIRLVGVLMVLVMDVQVLVLERFVNVFVLVALDEMQVEADRHEGCRHNQLPGHRLGEEGERQEGPDERGGRKVGAGPGRAEVAQREHEEDQADAVAQEADCAGPCDKAGAGKARGSTWKPPTAASA